MANMARFSLVYFLVFAWTSVCLANPRLDATSCADKSDLSVMAAALKYEATKGRHLKKDGTLILYGSTVTPRKHELGDIGKYIVGEAVISLVSRNARKCEIEFDRPTPHIRFVGREERKRLFASSQRDDDSDAWGWFYEVFPDSMGLVNLSLPGYDNSGNEALIYIEHQAGPLSAEGVVLRLRLHDRRWSVVERLSQWIS